MKIIAKHDCKFKLSKPVYKAYLDEIEKSSKTSNEVTFDSIFTNEIIVALTPMIIDLLHQTPKPTKELIKIM